MRIVFMGTPDYAVSTLKALIKSDNEIVGVFAQPDKPVGRKQILTPPPVKVCAEENGIKVYQPLTLKDGKALSILKELSPDIIVVVAYGKILPSEILSLPKYGCINGHASLLPRHRGASPIQWAIVSGDKETGVTVMQMDEGMDTGNIIDVEKTEIGEEETAEELFDRLSEISAALMVKVLKNIEKNGITSKEQPIDGVTYAPIIKKEMAKLDFREDAVTLNNKVRGFYSWPCAYFELDGKKIKVIKAKPINCKFNECGVVVESDNRFVISCKNNTALEILTVKPEGKKEMSALSMLNGHKITVGTKVN